MPTVTVLADNTVTTPRPAGLTGEWGFSAAIGDVLLDTGSTGNAARNAVRLGLDPVFDAIVLSHGHRDHTGGLPAFLVDDPRVYLHPEAWRARYNDGVHIGLPYTRDRVANAADVIEHTEPVEVADGVWALGAIPRDHPDNPSGVTPNADGDAVPDGIPDDQSVAVETADGIGLVLGCCHAGLRNTVEYAEGVLDAAVTAIVGGTHLVRLDADGVADTASWLADKPGLDVVAPSHCTGFEAAATLRDRLGDAFHDVGVGTQLEL